MPSGSGASKRKKWYLADCLTFLKDFVGQHRKSASNVTVEEDVDETQLGGEVINEDDDTIDSPLTNEVLDTAGSSRSSSANAAPARTASKRKSSALEAVTGPMINFLESRTVQSQPGNQPIPSMGPTAKFLDSLVSDVEKLNSKRQRLFKSKVLDILNNLLDEQEAEAEGCQTFFSRPTSSLSSSSSHHYTTLQGSTSSQLVDYINTYTTH